jgi:gliding motility-associated-like protein
MGTFSKFFCLLLFLISAITSFSQKDNKDNKKDPVITGQTPSPMTAQQGSQITITLQNLIVSDPDPTPVYPDGFTLEINSGENYQLSGTNVTPNPGFAGMLTVRVRVFDGANGSKWFDFKINILGTVNVAPQITGQVPITINQGESVTIAFSYLTVSDPDDNYPAGFTLSVFNGKDYTRNGNTVTPEANFSGNLKVPVSVNDGQIESKKFELKIEVRKAQNAEPKIKGQVPLSIAQGQSIVITLSHLVVEDPDNNYPTGFALTVYAGNNYSLTGNTVTPQANFSGNLKVPVSVNDGQNESKKFDLKVNVVSSQTNVSPTIVGQRKISITQGTPFTLQLIDLIVDDPDNQFPADFTLKVFPGSNYAVNGASITPAANFVNATLSVGVRVNDGTDDSPLFEVKIQVMPISATPNINSQRELTMVEDSTLTITLTDLIVTDADNPDYPKGFTLRVLSDPEGIYQSVGNTVRPPPDFNGLFEVRITVSDGQNTSNVFRLVILIMPVNDPPTIALLDSGPLPYEPGSEPAELFRRLVLADVDNEYLGMAEVGFRETNFSSKTDELLFDFDTTRIRVVRDPAGKLFLIGYATIQEYQVALRSIKYNYRITRDFNGEPEQILPGSRTIYVNVNDGQRISLDYERRIDIEARITVDIPTAFTPNGDNANDTWHLEVSNFDALDETTIRVYNKRGLLIFESDRFDKEWDGRYNGELLPVETYYYTIIISLPYSRQTFSGVVSILY